MNEPGPPPARRRLRLIALAVAVVCVLALAAGTFALSYPGARAIAVNAGVATNLARVYPGIFDAVLVVACAAALSLRRGWRVFAWLVVLVVIGTVAAADTAHAMSVALPKRPMEATAAVVPWVMLVIGLLLLDAMARQSRPGRNGVPPGYAAGPGPTVTADRHARGGQPAHGAATVPLSALLAARPAPPAATPPAPHPAGPPVTQPAARPAVHPFQPTAKRTTQPAVQQVTQPAAQQAGPAVTQPPAKPAGDAATKQAAEPATQPAGRPGTEAAMKPRQEKAGPPAETGPAKPQQPEPSKQEPSKPAGTEPGKPQGPMAGKPAEAEPVMDKRSAEAADQAQAGKPAAGSPDNLPEPTTPQPGGRDEPSDADAEPSEPSAFFSRLRRSLGAPGKAAKNGKPADTEPAPSEPAATEPAPSEPPPSEPAASKPTVTEPAPSEPPPSEPAASTPEVGERPSSTPEVGEPAASQEPAAEPQKAESGS